MANNYNPITGRRVEPDSSLEVPGGYIFFDDEDGLCWGDAPLPGGIDAGKLFQQLYGKDRPETYKEYLAKINAPPEDGRISGLEAGSAQDVLDAATESQVLVTDAKAIDYAELAGFPGSLAHGAVEPSGLKDTLRGRPGQAEQPVSGTPPKDAPPKDAPMNLGSLGVGASKPQAPLAVPDLAETVAARQAADKAAADKAIADKAIAGG